jgi:uncharacterized membrane protein YcjF (UPF0283 family)
VEELTKDPQVQSAIVAVAIAALGVVQMGIEWLRNRWKKTEWGKSIADESILMAVQAVYDEYVREIKEKSSDNRLTMQEVAEANRRAMQRAKDFADERGVEILKFYSADALKRAIEIAVSKLKGMSGSAGTPIARRRN